MPTDPYLADVSIFAGNFAPRGWAFCDGQLLPISQYSALFSLLGTIYGGDGRTTFALPDLRGRMPIGPGNGPGLPSYNLGTKSGNYEHQLTTGQMPQHNHSVRMHAEQTVADQNVPANRMLGVSPSATPIYADVVAADDIPMATQSITESNVGGNQTFNIMNPFLAIHYIIALQGVFPSRS